MAGQAIRCVELGRALKPHAEITIASPELRGPLPDGIEHVAFAPHAPRALRAPIAAADLIFAPPQWPLLTRWLARARAQVVFDLYDPETLETLELFAASHPAKRRLMVALTLDRLEDALRVGDRFVCAGERQRDLWLGTLLRSRRIGPASYERDPTLRALIDTVASGIPSEPAIASAGGPARAITDVDPNSEVILWNGGIWNWLDAETAIRAVALLATRRPAVRLVFMGGSAHVAAREATARARELARELGVLGSVVVFHEGWVPYEQRADWLLDADCSLSTHRSHLEARFAWRTRILDCFWAGLPVVCTEGDALAEQVTREDLGAAVAPEDPEALAAALEAVLIRGRAGYAEHLASAAEKLAWPLLAAPLIAWLEQGHAPPRDRDARVPPTIGHRARRFAYLAGGRLAMAARQRH